MAETVGNFFRELFGPYGTQLSVFFCSMLPIIELRGAIPLGAGFGLPWWQTFLISWVGNMIPVPFILLFIKRIIGWMATCRVKFFNKVANWLLAKADNADSITFHCPSRMLAQSEANIKEYLARRDTLKEILGEE